MAEKKSILEEALLDITNIQNALNANTKEILRSVAKEEIDGVVKESLNEKIYEEEEVESLEETEEEETKGEDEVKEGVYEEEEGLEMGDDLGMGEESPEEYDMTGASDDDVIAIYKKLSGDDEIEIVGDELHLNITEPGEYVVKLDSLSDVDDEEEFDVDDEEEFDVEDEEEFDVEDEEELGDETDDVEYDIEMDDEDESNEEEDEEEEEDIIASDEVSDEEDELEETRYVGGKVKKVATAHTNAKLEKESLQEVQKAKQIVSETAKKYNSLLTEAKKLKAENIEFRTALKEFRNKLVETVVFNSNLTYVTKILTEHSTTKAEKQNIIKRFDEVTNLKESKKLYKTIANELETRKPIAESVEKKIIKEAATSTSKQLNESTAYVDPSTKRIMDLINRVEKR
jgi:hypothetical protein